MSLRIPPSVRIRLSLSAGLVFLWVLALILNGLFSRPAAAALGAGDADTFRILASELIVDLDRAAARRKPGEAMTIAVWPHAAGETPMPARVATEINDRLLAALLDVGGHRHRFVARDALRAVVRDVAEASTLNRSLDQVLTALAGKSKADVLVVCKLRQDSDGRFLISYRAVDVEDGTIVAATSHRPLALTADDLSLAGAALTLEQALKDAVETLADRATEAEIVHLDGIHFEDSGRESPFGRYLEGRLADDLAEAYDNPVTGRSIILRHGVSDDETASEPGDLHDVPGAYRLSGRYWDFGEVVELRLSLQDHEGLAAVWRDRIRVSSLPHNLRRRPLDLLAEGKGHGTSKSRTEVAAGTGTPDIKNSIEPRKPQASSRMVRQVQSALGDLAYGPGPADGLLGPRTRAAIRQYQHDNGLWPDGRVTLALAEHLGTSRDRLASSGARRSDDPLPGDWRAGEPGPVARTSGGGIPPGFVPPPGSCRIWFPDRPAGHQPPPVPCEALIGRVPPGARLVYGAEPWPAPHHVESSLFTVLTPKAASRRLDRQDQKQAHRAYLRAGAAPIGQTIEWNNPRTGNGGSIVAVRDSISAQGRYCREFQQSVTVGDRRQDAYGVACQQPDGSWQLARR